MSPFSDIREDFRRRLESNWLKLPSVRRFGWALLFSALLTTILTVNLLPNRVNVKVGEPAPRDQRAPRDVVNRIATENKKAEETAAVKEQFEINVQVLTTAEEQITFIFDRIRNLRNTPDLNEAAKLEAFKSQTNLAINDAPIVAALRADENSLPLAEGSARQLIQEALSLQLKDEAQVLTQQREIQDKADALRLSRDLRTFISEVAKAQVRPNLVLNVQLTEMLRQQAAADVKPVVVRKGTIIIEAGKEVTEEQVAILEDLGLQGRGTGPRAVFGSAIFVLVLLTLVGLYLWQFRRDLLESDSKLILLGLVLTATVILATGLKNLSGFLIPVATGSMLITTLIDSKLALLTGIVLGLFMGVVLPGDLSFLLVAIVGPIVGVYSVSRVEQRSDLMRAGIIVGLANALSILSLHLIDGRSLLDLAVWRNQGFGVVNGILSAILTIGSLPYLESAFGIITPIKLLELSNPNQPLLKRLLVEAPGTYHHSILVANLAEAAAQAVGANSALARVGAYYHDVGKIKRPYFFIDNQFGGENPHDQIPPSLSALIVASHVKEGVELAREYRLPREIVDFVREHHGTSLISFFFNRATENGKSEYLCEEDFRYEGPKPQSKETAIVMLADAAEASVRAMSLKKQPGVEQIEAQVRKIIHERLHEGQLDKADLTLRDLDCIGRAFTKVLSGIFHTRIEYPQNTLANERKAANLADHGDRSTGEGNGNGRPDSPGGGSGGSGSGLGGGET